MGKLITTKLSLSISGFISPVQWAEDNGNALKSPNINREIMQFSLALFYIILLHVSYYEIKLELCTKTIHITGTVQHRPNNISLVALCNASRV